MPGVTVKLVPSRIGATSSLPASCSARRLSARSAGIAAIIVLVVFAFGTQIKAVFQDTCNTVNTGSGSGTGCP